MAMGCPIVASPQAAEGIDARHGEHLLIAPDPKAEAEAVLALLGDPQRAATLGRAARLRVEQRYDWSATLAPLRAQMARWLETPGANIRQLLAAEAQAQGIRLD